MRLGKIIREFEIKPDEEPIFLPVKEEPVLVPVGGDDEADTSL